MYERSRIALDFLQNPNTITFVTLRLEFIERSEFHFHRLAALGLQITIEIVSARAISRHLLFPDSDNKSVRFRNFEFRGLRNFGSDEVFCEGSHVYRVLELLGDVFSEGFYSRVGYGRAVLLLGTIEGDATVSLMVEYLRFRKGGSEKNAVFDER